MSAIADVVPSPSGTRWMQALRVLRDPFTLRRIRVACGCVMLCYLTLHFLNHSLGNISLEAMMWGTQIHEWIWHGPSAAPRYTPPSSLISRWRSGRFISGARSAWGGARACA